MITSSKSSVSRDNIWSSIVLLTGFFFLLEVSFFIQCNKAYLSDFDFVSSHISIPLAVLPGILFFSFSQLIVHVTFAILTWCMAVAIIESRKVSRPKQLTVALCTWIYAAIVVLVANQYFFPNAKFSELTHLFLVNSTITHYVFNILFVLTLPLLFITLRYWFRRFVWLGALVVVSLSFLYWHEHRTINIVSAATIEQPNVIIVSVDSLRPDFLGYFGRDISTPFFDKFLSQSATFSDAVTPLARTFPSWTGVLTGQYPRQTGVRSNLSSQTHLNLADTLPAILRAKGYATVYATDEARFSNIDKNFGFNEVISPRMGLNDFLIGTFNDFPLSNLLINTRIGKWLFPYSYANRPVYAVYNPNSFLAELHDVIYQQRQQPLLMAVHFCLPHNPYLWAQLNGNDYSILERYQASVVRVDKQVSDFFVMLQQTHMLDHAVVIMMSDHGEGLELRGDRITERDSYVSMPVQPAPKFYPQSLDDEDVNQSAGHGTDVLGLPQYHSLLAFRVYGGKPVAARAIPGVVSLLDIKPTVLALLNLPSHHNSGVSLKGLLYGQEEVSLPRDIFLESDFSPQSIRTVYPETRQVMLEGIELFEIDQHSTRLTVKDTMAAMIIKSKQYADIYGEWMLAMYPQSNKPDMPILINLASGEWTNDLHSSLAVHSPAQIMLDKMEKFFGSDLRKS